MLLYLYQELGDVRYKKAADKLRAQIASQPRDAVGGFWHKQRYPNQMWLDGLYMGQPFYAEYTSKFENGKNLNDVAKQFELIEANDKDSKTGLLYHAWDESKMMPWADKVTGKSPNFWFTNMLRSSVFASSKSDKIKTPFPAAKPSAFKT